MLRPIIGSTIAILLALTAVEVFWNEVDYVIYMIIICLILIQVLFAIWSMVADISAGIISIIIGSYAGFIVFISDKSDYLLLPIAKGIGAGLLCAMLIFIGLIWVAIAASKFNPEFDDIDD